MDKELREAAERRRKFVASCKSRLIQIGHGSPYFDEDDCTIDFDLHHDDMMLLADAYLAEHPADDGEPISVEWLKDAGFKFYADLYGSSDWWQAGWLRFFPLSSFDNWEYNRAAIPDQPTRGHVRRLCQALGIPLKG